MLGLFLAGIVICLIIYRVQRYFRYWDQYGVKTVSSIYLLKELVKVYCRQRIMTDMCKNVYNAIPNARYFGVYQFSKPALVLKDADLITELTTKHFDHFTDHQYMISEKFEPMWGKSLFIIKGQRWRTIRHIISPSFTSNKLKIMFGLITDSAKNFTDHFLQKNEDVIEVELKDVFTRFTNDVLTSTSFGLAVDSFKNPNNQFLEIAEKMCNFTSGFGNLIKFNIMVQWPALYEFLGLPVFDTTVNDFFEKLVEDTIHMREERGIVRPDMIHLLMEAKKESLKEIHIDNGKSEDADNKRIQLTNKDIAAQAFFFYLAGFDNVATLLCFCCYEIVVNPEIQDRLRAEVQESFDKCGGAVTYDTINELKYFGMVLKETLRKWPPVFAADRVCTKSFTIQPKVPDEQPVYLKEGSIFWLPIYALHYDPSYFPDPETFDPERFNPKNKQNIKAGTFLAFGSGPRSCIGYRLAFLEVKTFLFHLLYHFEIVKTQKSQIPIKLKPTSPNLCPSDGFWFAFRKIRR
uniref:Cytochrome P450 9e2-like n=1 Tax=Diabrotica virgifera virgifera TaxID=50390 RepID=A0A6P7GFV2_DIAVI